MCAKKTAASLEIHQKTIYNKQRFMTTDRSVYNVSFDRYIQDAKLIK